MKADLLGLCVIAFAAASGRELPAAPGRHEDVSLLKRIMDSHDDLVLQRATAQSLLRRFGAERHDARLAELGKSGSVLQKQRALEARQRLGSAWRALSLRMDSRWPIDPRLTCRAPALDLRGAMAGARGSLAAAGLTEARLAARACLAKLRGVLEPLRKANAAMAASVAEADDILSALDESAPPPGTTPLSAPAAGRR